jgi:alpha-methylacyl-CoA racemase
MEMPSINPNMGPLAGVKVLEFSGIGPGPFAAMLLADMGANVLVLYNPARTRGLTGDAPQVVERGRAGSVAVDLKRPEDAARARALAQHADVLLEGMRPGVMERLGLGPERLLELNPRLVYGRVTGYGQDGPLSQSAGHDINYLAMSGALGAMAREGERPLFPLNLLGDYGGGGMLLAFGVLCALTEARASGHGQVVDAAMVDGVTLLTSFIHGLRAAGKWSDSAGSNVLDSGAHFYEVYATSDGGHVAVGAIEPQFYSEFLTRLDIDATEMPQWDRERWPEFKARLAVVFATRTRAEWAEAFESAEACVSPVLGLGEASMHPHNQARESFLRVDGVLQPAPAPRFSRSLAEVYARACPEDLAAWGLADSEIAAARHSGPPVAGPPSR